MKKYFVRFLAEAIDDLDAVYLFIADQSSFEIADGYLARIERQCLSLSSLPYRGTAVVGSVLGLRIMGFERRVTILFRVEGNTVEILRILYGGQDWTQTLDQPAEM